MSLTLYRQYRPQKFSEIIGQKHIVQTLSNAVKSHRLGHAYLFTGPRGTGKTTLARVFAKAVNCANLVSEERVDTKLGIRRSPAEADNSRNNNYEPCNTCDICKNINEGRSLDIIEIDAASNTGVDNIRELRETVKLPPTQAKYKVYIIDEAHMLSAGAFNALLKTLEEPPAHVIFILATTEIHKVPETIISRCQRFDFSRLTLEQITGKLSRIAASEKVEIEKDALEMIAIAAEGGMRDAESLLEQIIALEDKNITAKEVEDILGAARHESVEKLAGYVLEKDAAGALDLVNQLSGEGINFEVFHKSLLNYLRQMLIVSVNPDLVDLFSLELTKEQIKNISERAEKHSSGEILAVLENLIEAQQKIRSSFIPSLPLEMAIVKSTQKLTTDNLQPTTNDKVKNSGQKISNISAEGRSASGGQFLPPQRDPAKAVTISNKISNPKFQNSKQSDNSTGSQNLEKNSNSAIQQSGNLTIETVRNNWKEIIESTCPLNHSLMAFLSNCQPVKIDGGKITIAVKYNLYKDKLNDQKNRLTIEEVVSRILGSPLKVKFLTEEEAGIKITGRAVAACPPDGEASPHSKKGESKSLLDDAMKIMGGKVVKE